MISLGHQAVGIGYEIKDYSLNVVEHLKKLKKSLSIKGIGVNIWNILTIF